MEVRFDMMETSPPKVISDSGSTLCVRNIALFCSQVRVELHKLLLIAQKLPGACRFRNCNSTAHRRPKGWPRVLELLTTLFVGLALWITIALLSIGASVNIG